MPIHPAIPSGRDIHPDLLARFATIIIGWANVEALMAEFLSFLLQADPGSMYVFNQTVASSTQLKWMRLLAASRFTNPTTQEALTDLFNRIQTTADERNGYVHGLWSAGPEPGTATVQTINVNRAEIIRSLLVTNTDLNELISEVEDIAAELYELGVRLNFVPT